MRPPAVFWLSMLFLVAGGSVSSQETTPQRVTVAASHYAFMFNEPLLGGYGVVDNVRYDGRGAEFVLREGGLVVSMASLPPGKPKAFTADVVLLVRSREDEAACWKEKGYQELFAGHAIGHNSVSVVVDPSSPVTRLRMNELKDILSGKIKSWKSFGGGDKQIKLVYDWWGGRTARSMVRRVIRPAVRVGHTWRILRSLAGDADTIAIVQTTEWLPDTGMKFVSIVAEPDEEKVDLAANHMSILCRRGASAEAKAFAEYARDRFCEGFSTRAGAWVAVLGPPRDDAWPAPGSLAAPRGISGAVAVLCIEPKAMYFLPLKPDHVAAMELEISQTIAAGRSLTLVDRQELDKVLAERRLAMLFDRDADALPRILAADVLLDSSIVTEDHRTCLLIQAIHSTTGSRLGWMRLGLDPTKPGGFDPSLEKRIARWWPGVLANLERVRTLPIVTVLGVYPGNQTWEEAGRVTHAVEEAFRGEPRCFLAERRPSVSVETENVLRIMGLSSACGGSVTPVADYAAEVRLVSDRRAEVRLTRANDRKVLANSAVDGESRPTLRAAAAEWFRKQSDHCATKPPTRRVWWKTDPWAREQARREFEAAQQMHRELEEEIKKRAVEVAPNTFNIPTYPDDTRRKREIVRRAMLAQQLDPTNEEIVRWTLNTATSVSADFLDCRLGAAVGDRYIASFPLSKPRRHLYEWVLNDYSRLTGLCSKTPEESHAPRIPRGMDYRRWEIIYRARTIEISRMITDRMVQDWRPGMSADMQPRWIAGLFQGRLALQLHATSASDVVVNEAVNFWAQRYDHVPEIVPPSPFLRLGVLVRREQKRAAASLFVALVRARPEAKDRFWTFLERGAASLGEVDYKLNEAAQEWKRGKIPTEDLIRTAEARLKEIPEK